MMAVYYVLKHKETTIKTVDFNDLFSCLKCFFTKGAEKVLEKTTSNIFDLHSFKYF